MFAQGRTELLTPTADYKGFAAWADRNGRYFRSLQAGIVVFGEGLVLYPTEVAGADSPAVPELFSQLMFKAKGKKHQTIKAHSAVQVRASVVASIDEFVSMMLAKARLEQGLAESCGGRHDPKLTSNFLASITKNVKKESSAEMEASGLTWLQVVKML